MSVVRRLPVLIAALAVAVTVSGCSAPAPLDFPLLEVEEGGAVTDPGTELGLDDIGLIDNAPHTTAISLRAIEPLTTDDWADLVENPDDFAGYTPVVLIVEQHVFGEPAEGFAAAPVDVFPIYADGEVAPYVVVDNFFMGEVDQTETCGHSLHTTQDSEQIFQYCLIGAAETGDIVGIRYDGQSDQSIIADESTPYWADPIFWRA